MKNLSKYQERLTILHEINIYFLYNQNYYKLIDIDLSRQTNTTIPQQINVLGKLEEDDGVTVFFITEKQQKTIINISLGSLNVME